MQLLDFIASLDCPDEHLLFCDSRAGSSKSSLVQAGFRREEKYRDLKGQNVALKLDDPLALAVSLVVLDGLAARITIIPPESDAVMTQFFCEQTESSQLVSSSLDRYASSGSSAGACPPEPPVTTEWVLTTSGTTGSPKLVKHLLANLSASIRPGRSGSGYRWGLTYALERYAGVQVFLQSLLAGSTLVFPGRGATVDETLALFAQHGVNAISATPSQWRKYLMSPGLDTLSLRTITLGGEIADQVVLNALKQRFPSAHIQHIYASTEAGVGFGVSDGQAGFPSSYLTDGVNGVHLRVSPHGTLTIRSDSTARQYLGRDDLPVDADGYVDTGDLLEEAGDRYLFQGRLNGAINVGGNKVQPELIENILHEIDGVAMASVSAVPNSIVGNLVRARVVMSNPASNLERQEFSRRIKAYCGERLERYMVPALIDFVDEIDTNASGKAAR